MNDDGDEDEDVRGLRLSKKSWDVQGRARRERRLALRKSFEYTAGHLMKAKDYGNFLTNKNIKIGINLKSGSV